MALPLHWLAGLCAYIQQNVTQATIANGLTNLGIFTRYYRQEFGEKPSETLKG